MDEINAELKAISESLSIDYRVEVMATKNAFITLKDHKENFDSNPNCGLLNPRKSELEKVSKVILDTINDIITSTINVKQWKNLQSVIEWCKLSTTNPTTYFSHSILLNSIPQSLKNFLNVLFHGQKR